MSGYQESLVKISCLAEAAGIRKAFDEQKVPFFRMHGVERAIRDVSPDLPSRDGDMLCLPRIPIRVGDLFVVLCGDRHPYQFCSGRWFYIDGLADAVHENYRSYLVPVDEGSVRSSWGDNARLAQRSYVNWKITSPTSRLPGTETRLTHGRGSRRLSMVLAQLRLQIWG